MKNSYEVRGDDIVIFLPHRKLATVFETVISATDFDLVISSYSCTYHAAKSTNGKCFYVVGKILKKQFFLHKRILGIGKECQGDHVDGDAFNNRRGNLRKLTPSGNCLAKRKGPRKLFDAPRGVFWVRSISKWEAKIEAKSGMIRLGYFTDPLEAGRIVAAKREELIARETFA